MEPNDAALMGLLGRVERSLKAGALIEVRLRPASGDPVDIRPVTLREAPMLSFTRHEARRDISRNLSPAEGRAELERLLRPGGTAWLRTTGGAWQWVAPPGKRSRLVAHRMEAVAPASGAHDRTKHKHLSAHLPWFRLLGLTDERGRPMPGRSDKIRQIERYADILMHLVHDTGFKHGDTISVADMGCGKGYLTFAAWQVLRNGLGSQVRVVGLDAQEEVVSACASVVHGIGAESLTFMVGDISTADFPSPDILIALHACNDATDRALIRGVAAGARLILVAPCCHKDVRRALGAPVPLAPVLHHGLFKERFSEWLTDALRVLALEAAGYRVSVSEFVDAEHTPRNVLIGAIFGIGDARRAEARRQYDELKAWSGCGPLPTDGVLQAAGE